MTVRELQSVFLDLVLAHRDVMAGEVNSDYAWHEILISQISTADERIRTEGLSNA